MVRHGYIYRTNLEKRLKAKRSVIYVRTNDDWNLVRAIIIAIAKIRNDPQLKSICKLGGKNSLQTRQTIDFLKKCDLFATRYKLNTNDLPKIQAYLKGEFQIKVISKMAMDRIIYKGDKENKIICLYQDEDRFHVITSMTGFLDINYYCSDCDKPYTHVTEHVCEALCQYCRQKGKCAEEKWLYCANCLRNFPSKKCLDNHKRKKVIQGTIRHNQTTCICKILQRCRVCNVLMDRITTHDCNKKFCSTCKRRVEKHNHQCFVQRIKPKNPNKFKFIFFDFECAMWGQENEHRPMLCVAQYICNECIDGEFGTCTKCKNNNEKIFQGEECLVLFCEWLFSDENEGSIAIAHNMRGYDGQFVIKYMIQQGIKPDIIPKGNDLMYIQGGGIKIIDSLNYISCALANFPTMFDLKELKKGWFPHEFNKKQNWAYSDKMPELAYFRPDDKSPAAREALIKWHQENANEQFNFWREIIEYCRSDVDILRCACLTLRKLFLEKVQVDPFYNGITIAGVCMTIYRSKYMPDNGLAIVPYGGYSREKMQSAIAIKWLKWLSRENNTYIRHAANGLEVVIPVNGKKYKVDGFNENDKTTVYEFNGCPWHGCLRCYPKRDMKIKDRTVDCLYQRTMDKKWALENAGYTVVDLWQCQLTDMLKRDDNMKRFFDNIQTMQPINPRDAFFGGRTNGTYLHKEINEGEKIHYIDICSLYPYICKYGRFPIGHPKIITENFKSIGINEQPYEGLIKCKILPPRKLFHPVLPQKIREKLMFTLCTMCAQENNDQCTHTDEERATVGTWVCHELYKAVACGYKVLAVYEVWQYDRFAEYKNAKSFMPQGIFSQYIDCFIKLKVEASGWPSWVNNESDKDKYIQEWKQKENIDIDKDSVKKMLGCDH